MHAVLEKNRVLHYNIDSNLFGGIKWADRMDIKLHYIEKGEGMPFIFLHGNGEDGSYFKHQIEFFSKKYRAIAVDTRGHGKSPRGAAPFTIEQFADDLNELLGQQDIRKILLLGFSDGANIAMRFALKYPDKLAGLILNGGNLNASGVKKTTQIPIEIGYRIASRFIRRSPEAKRNAEMLGLMVNEPNIVVSELSAITVPTLVIAGTKDMIKESHTKEIAENIAHAELVLLKGDHFIANKEYKAFNLAVARFLDANGANM